MHICRPKGKSPTRSNTAAISQAVGVAFVCMMLFWLVNGLVTFKELAVRNSEFAAREANREQLKAKSSYPFSPVHVEVL